MPIVPARDTTMKCRRTLVFGATGLTGRPVVSRLLADRHYDGLHVLRRRGLPILGRLQRELSDG